MSSPLRVVFMGSPAIAVPTLRALVEAGHDVVGVVTQPDQPAGRGHRLVSPAVKDAAVDLGLSVYQPPRLRRPEAMAEITGCQPDAIVVFAYGQILRSQLLSLPRLGCLNVHPSLLPEYRGVAPINWAIMEGKTRSGVSIMLMDEGIDSGPVLSQRSVDILSSDDAVSLGRRMAGIGADLLVATLSDWAQGLIKPVAQDPQGATFTRMLKREDGLVDWTLPAVEIERRSRAFRPWPRLYTTFSGLSLGLLEVCVVRESCSDGEPGLILDGSLFGDSSVICVATGDGVIGVRQLQQEGRKAVTAPEFARGHRAIIGVRLG